MKILVYPHDFGVGGSQLNAIQFAAAARKAGHQVVIYGQEGPLLKTVAEYGLEFVPSPRTRRRPTPGIVADIRRLVRERGIDVVHGYEWPPALEAYLAVRGLDASVIATVMSMDVAPFLPSSLPLVVGTEQLAADQRLRGRADVTVIEPPVDTELDHPEADIGIDRFRETWKLDPAVPTVAVVSRLAAELKLEGILTAIDTVRHMRRTQPIRLLIAGDGPEWDQVAARAAAANEAVGSDTVVMTGMLADPRPAYGVADVVLGMGSSALRGMAYAKPLIVQGEGGFWRTLTPDTLGQFTWTGWYGYGDAGSDPIATLGGQLGELLAQPRRREELGAFSLATVRERYSLAAAGQRQVELYERVVAQRRIGVSGRAHLGADARAVGRFAAHTANRFLGSALKLSARDDFNARPLARDVEPAAIPASAGSAREEGAILYFAGAPWDAVTGTDKNLVRALVGSRRVIWVDPPSSPIAHLRSRERSRGLTCLGPNLLGVHPIGPPGVTKPLLRSVAYWWAGRQGMRAARAQGGGVGGVVVSSPLQLIPRGLRGVARIYFETDDFVAGAELFGISRRAVSRRRRVNVARSTLVLGVTGALAQSVAGGRRPWQVLANGCTPSRFDGWDAVQPADDVLLDRPIAAVVGQFNDRLDLDALEEVADRGLSLLLLGPRHRSSEVVRRRFEALSALPNVQWLDRRPANQLPRYFATIDVGLTPYTNTAFNRASCPLKTLEYLAAGKAVVASDLPAVHDLGTSLVRTASSSREFADETENALSNPGGIVDFERRRAFARDHDWSHRAAQLIEYLKPEGPLPSVVSCPTVIPRSALAPWQSPPASASKG